MPLPRFRLSLLARFELTGPDGPVELPNKKLAGLLAYLACTAPVPQSREKLATLLWGSFFDAQARANLRQALYRLRQTLGHDALTGDGDEISLLPGVVDCDAARLEALIQQGSRASLTEAVDLYKERLLADVAITEEAWADWAAGERQRLEGLALDALVRLGEIELALGHPDKALEPANRALAINDLREDAHRLIVQALAAAGRKAEALKHYQDLGTLLKRELNTEPDAATKSLVVELGTTEPESPDIGVQQLKNIAHAARVFSIELENVTNINPKISPQHKAAPSLPDKPSIAVLPFTNLSGDPSQDYFSDGITEDIITELSRFSDLFVIARNSSFQYKGKSPDVRQVGRELGVRYVLEGAIRKAGDRVRISGQLIDAATGAHRWAERFDRKLEDIFSVQDEVARTIVAILAAHVNKAEAERTLLKPPATWQAYDYYLRATETLALFTSSLSAVHLYDVRRLLQQALSSDPNFTRGYATLALTHLRSFVHSLDGDYLNPAALDQAHQWARKAVQLDPNSPQAHSSLGTVMPWTGQHEESIAEFEKAVTLNPNFSDYHFAVALLLAGEFARAVEIGKVHMRLDPFYVPFAPAWLGFAYYMLKRYSDALPLLRESISRAPNLRFGHVLLACTYAQIGRIDEARAHAAEVLRIEPSYTIDGVQRRLTVFRAPTDAEHFFDGLRKTGLPER